MIIKKKVGILIAIILVASISAYFYLSTRIIDPFIIDASKVTVEKAAPDLIDTKQDYNFILVNSSDRAVKLLNIELSGYSGIELGNLVYKGASLNGLEIPSHRVYDLTGWHTDQGLEIDYIVTIKDAKIINPKIAAITYSYLGIQRQQSIQLP